MCCLKYYVYFKYTYSIQSTNAIYDGITKTDILMNKCHFVIYEMQWLKWYLTTSYTETIQNTTQEYIVANGMNMLQRNYQCKLNRNHRRNTEFGMIAPLRRTAAFKSNLNLIWASEDYFNKLF